MSSRQFCVLVLPCANQKGWVEAVSKAAAQAGWATTAKDAERLDCQLVVSTQAEEVLGWRGEDVAILASSTREAVTAAVEVFEVDHAAAVRHVAGQYAHAERLIREGASWLSADADVLDLPFGSVTNPCPAAQALEGDESALSYLNIPGAPPLGQAIWPADLFLHERPGKPDTNGKIFDLTGRRRILRYGPYINMPIGVWKVVVPFTLWIDTAVAEIRVEWASLQKAVSATEVIRQSGRYEASLSLAWESVGPCEIRIWLDRAVFDGAIQLHDPKIIRL